MPKVGDGFISRVGREWRRLREAHPGRRFRERFGRKHSVGDDRPIHRLLYISGGVLVSFTGLVIHLIPFMPGGSALVALGAALVSRESKTAAAWLDRCELRMRNIWSRAYRRATHMFRK